MKAPKMLNRKFVLASLILLMIARLGRAQSNLVQVKEDFSSDPGWDNINNRVEAANPPTVTQDFGWSEGKIGGAISRSTTPAWYGLPLDPPRSFNDGFSVSGKIAVTTDLKKGGEYIGFFN